MSSALLTRWLFVPPATFAASLIHPAQDGLLPAFVLQGSSCHNFAKWLLSKSWASQAGWLLHLAALAKRCFLILSPLLADHHSSCQEDGLTHQCIHFKPTSVSPRLTPKHNVITHKTEPSDHKYRHRAPRKLRARKSTDSSPSPPSSTSF